MVYSDTDFQPEIQPGWEVLPSPSTGLPHLVDPDPDAMFESYPVSLCGTMLSAKGGVIADSSAAVCPICLEISVEREGEFTAMLRDGEL